MTDLQIKSSHQQYKQVETSKQGLPIQSPANVVSNAIPPDEVIKKTQTAVVTKEQEAQLAKDQEEQLTRLQEKVSQLNSHMQNLSRDLQFSVDEHSGDTVVTVRDSETKEVIRQFPSEEVLDARHAVDKIKGLLIEAKV